MPPVSEFAVHFSHDQEAVRAFVHWRKVADDGGQDRTEAVAKMHAARQRCLAAGVDWSRVPRSRAAPATTSPPPRGPVPAAPPEPSALVSMRLAVDVAQRSAPPPSRPATAPSATPPSGAGSLPPANAGMPGGLASAAAPDPGPAATSPIPGATGAGSGYSVADPTAQTRPAYGQQAADMTTDTTWDWLGGAMQTAPAAAAAGGVMQGPDGTAWYLDAQGGAFGVSADGTQLALSPDGQLFGQAMDGSLYSWVTDGDPVMLGADGQLWTSGTAEPTLIADAGQPYDVYGGIEPGLGADAYGGDPLGGYGDIDPTAGSIDPGPWEADPTDSLYGADPALPGDVDPGADAGIGYDAGGWGDGSMLS